MRVRNALQKQLEDAQEVRACGAKPTAEEALTWAIADLDSRLRRLVLVAKGVSESASPGGGSPQ
jgi:hypothetical protein